MHEVKQITVETVYDIVRRICEQNPIHDRLVFDSLALCAESGELANHVKKMVYYLSHPNRQQEIRDELTDVIFHVLSIGLSLNLELEDILANIILKYGNRW